MRVILFVLTLTLTLTLVSPAVQAQVRPAPETPDAAEGMDDVPLPSAHFVDALRVIAVTAGIIGGFVAADLISGGALTGPLLAGSRTVPVGLRPVVITSAPPAVSVAAATGLPELRRALGTTLSAASAARP